MIVLVIELQMSGRPINKHANGSPVITDNNPYLNFTGMSATSFPIRIGSSYYDSGGNKYELDGKLDHLNLWQGTLTTAEIASDAGNMP